MEVHKLRDHCQLKWQIAGLRSSGEPEKSTTPTTSVTCHLPHATCHCHCQWQAAFNVTRHQRPKRNAQRQSKKRTPAFRNALMRWCLHPDAPKLRGGRSGRGRSWHNGKWLFWIAKQIRRTSHVSLSMLSSGAKNLCSSPPFACARCSLFSLSLSVGVMAAIAKKKKTEKYTQCAGGYEDHTKHPTHPSPFRVELLSFFIDFLTGPGMRLQLQLHSASLDDAD